MLKDSALIIAFVGALLYFTGWAYLYAYFEYFGISLIEINPSIQFVLMHALSPYYYWASNLDLKEFVPWLIIVLGVIVILHISGLLRGVFGFLKTRLSGTSETAGPGVTVIVVLALFGTSLAVSRSAGDRTAAETWSNPGRIIYISQKSDNLNINDNPHYNLKSLNDDLQLKYLFSSTNNHYAFLRERQCGEPRCGLIFKIPVDNVEEIAIITQWRHR